MQIFVPRETQPGEIRISLLPAGAAKLKDLGAQILIESGLGEPLSISDDEYKEAGADITTDRLGALGAADLVVRLNKPPREEAGAMKSGCIHISYLDPFREHELVDLLAKANTSSFSMEMIPRSTIAQKMDALSSQANLAGYVAVIAAAERLPKVLPMMSTPAGTLAPARYFIIGAGVAGLQAIATAKRLGAVVEAFDTRPVVEEQVKSLGARFVKIDLGDTGQTEDGYAKELTEEQLKLQREGMAKRCAAADVVITTAQLFGRAAPRILTGEMIAQMKPGSLIIDLAVETGGNVEGSKVDEEVVVNGVRIIGLSNLPGRVPVHASQMYSSNIANFIDHFWDKDNNTFPINLDDELISGALVTHGGNVVNETIQKAYVNA